MSVAARVLAPAPLAAFAPDPVPADPVPLGTVPLGIVLLKHVALDRVALGPGAPGAAGRARREMPFAGRRGPSPRR